MLPRQATAIRYIIGIDGGGTGTRARVAVPDGRVLGSGEAGPSALAQGLEQALVNIVRAIDNAFHAAEVARAEEYDCAVGMGLAGANFRIFREPFLAMLPRFGHVAVDTDAYTTLLGAHKGLAGAVVTSGTGSVGQALRRDGSRVAVGGWGFPVGDEGSGGWLGLRAMLHTQHAVDGLAASGVLTEAIRSHAGSTREELLDWCGGAGQFEYAQLAPLVFAAEHEDPFAAMLLTDAARSLESIAFALDPEGVLPLVVAGSVGQKLQHRFSPALLARCVPPAGDAVDGAVRLAIQGLNGPG